MYGPYSTVTYTADGVTNQFSVTFPYILQTDVNVQVNGVAAPFSWATSTTIQLTNTPLAGSSVLIYRKTDFTVPVSTWTDGGTLRSADLNAEVAQLLYGAQEAQDTVSTLVANAYSTTGNLPLVSVANNASVLQVSGGIWTTTPLSTYYTTALLSTGGLQYTTGLGVKLSDTSLQTAAGGISVKLGTNSGLQVSTGLQLLLADVSLTKNVNGVLVQLTASGGLSLASGIQVSGVRVISADPGSPTSGDWWYNSTFGTYRRQEAGATLGMSGVLYRNTAVSTAIGNTAALTACNLQATVPANHLSTGKKFRVRGTGLWGATGSSPTLIIGLYRDGTTSVIDTFTIACGTVTAGRFDFQMELTVFTTGAGGTWQPAGLGFSENLATAAAQQTIGNNGTLTIDTTVSHTLGLAFQWSVASVSNTVTVKTYSVEVLDP